MRVRERGGWDQRAGAKEIVGGRDVVACFVPVIRKPKQRRVRNVDGNKNQRKHNPQGKWTVQSRLEVPGHAQHDSV